MKLTSLLLVTSAALACGGPEIQVDYGSADSTVSTSWSGNRPDGHAPIGVMGEHTHNAGEWMLSYRYMYMSMEDNYDGTSRISDDDVLADPNYMVVPLDMDMHMHMLGLMYAPTDRLTLMGMVNLVEMSMDHRMMNGMTFETESSGLGDSSLTAMYRFWDGHRQRAHFGLSLLLPTAEVDEEDFIPAAGTDTRLPYPMQLGSGSWGLGPSLTWLGQNDCWSWGAQLSGKFYLDDNDEGYRLGDRGELTAWGARRINEWLSLSLRLAGSTWGNISGEDDDLLPLPVPTVDPDLRGGSKLDASAGFNVQFPGTGARLGVEAGLPLWQDLNGPQLGSDWWIIAGVQWAF